MNTITEANHISDRTHMNFRLLTTLNLIPLLAATLVLGACAKPPAANAQAQAPAAAPVAQATAEAAKAPQPLVLVHKSASCGCCGLWVEHLRQRGFQVDVRNEENLNPIKERLGVPHGKGSCHTAEVDGYVIEGHVPVEDIERLLAERPDARGLVLPGMPAGSPGMEMPDGRVQPYTVELVARDGSTRPFAQHGTVATP